jgi:hypothetical protein
MEPNFIEIIKTNHYKTPSKTYKKLKKIMNQLQKGSIKFQYMSIYI